MRTASLLLSLLIGLSASVSLAASPPGLRLAVYLPAGATTKPLDGRVLLLLSPDSTSEPRFQARPGVGAIQLFGVNVEDWQPGRPVLFDATVFGYPKASLADVPPGTYSVQALLHEYETFHLQTGHTVQLPMDRGEGQNWRIAPGNRYSTPQRLRIDPHANRTLTLTLDQVIPPIPPPQDTKYVRHLRIQSDRLTAFWGRPMHLGAHVLLPEGFDEHPEARYPLVIFHGHFPADFAGRFWRIPYHPARLQRTLPVQRLLSTRLLQPH